MPEKSIRENKALSNVSVNYKNADYIAQDVLADYKVTHQSDNYLIYNSDYRLPETYQANGSPANVTKWSASTSSYFCAKHSLKDVITDVDKNNVDSPLNLDRDTVEFLTDKIQLRQEYDAAKLLFTTTTFSNYTALTGDTHWDTTTAAPIQNVLSATGVILQSVGRRPNKIAIGWTPYVALRENSSVYGRVQYVERAVLTPDLLASLFDVGKLFAGAAQRDTSMEGIAASKSNIWGNYCLVGFFENAPGLKKVSAGNLFRATSEGSPFKVRKWYDEDVEGTWIQVQTMYQAKTVATSAGYLFSDVL